MIQILVLVKRFAASGLSGTNQRRNWKEPCILVLEIQCWENSLVYQITLYQKHPGLIKGFVNNGDSIKHGRTFCGATALNPAYLWYWPRQLKKMSRNCAGIFGGVLVSTSFIKENSMSRFKKIEGVCFWLWFLSLSMACGLSQNELDIWDKINKKHQIRATNCNFKANQKADQLDPKCWKQKASDSFCIIFLWFSATCQVISSDLLMLGSHLLKILFLFSEFSIIIFK